MRSCNIHTLPTLSKHYKCSVLCTCVCEGVDGIEALETSKICPTNNILICRGAIKGVKDQLRREGGGRREGGRGMRGIEE